MILAHSINAGVLEDSADFVKALNLVRNDLFIVLNGILALLIVSNRDLEDSLGGKGNAPLDKGLQDVFEITHLVFNF